MLLKEFSKKLNGHMKESIKIEEGHHEILKMQ
jgi:hypothetical protein